MPISITGFKVNNNAASAKAVILEGDNNYQIDGSGLSGVILEQISFVALCGGDARGACAIKSISFQSDTRIKGKFTYSTMDGHFAGLIAVRVELSSTDWDEHAIEASLALVNITALSVNGSAAGAPAVVSTGATIRFRIDGKNLGNVTLSQLAFYGQVNGNRVGVGVPLSFNPPPSSNQLNGDFSYVATAGAVASPGWISVRISVSSYNCDERAIEATLPNDPIGPPHPVATTPASPRTAGGPSPEHSSRTDIAQTKLR